MSVGVRSLHPYIRYRKLKDPQNAYIAAHLPAPYQKFYREWMGNEEKETPVHWKPRTEKWVRNPETGEVKTIQNMPIPIEYPPEMHQCLWGGEGVVEGLIKKAKYRSPVPKYWVPTLYKTVLRSEVLDKYLSVIVTERALKLIDDHSGLDSYLLKTPAYDLKTLLALKLKRKLFLTLLNERETGKQTENVDKYADFLITRDEAEWYGYSVNEARIKYEMILKQGQRPVPLKYQLRKDLYQELLKGTEGTDSKLVQESSSGSWVKKLNPFSKPA